MLKTPAALLGASALVCAGEMVREQMDFRVRHYRINTDRLPEGERIRFVFASDLHGKQYGKENRRLLEAVKHTEPDFILLGGDLLTRSVPASDRIAAAFCQDLANTVPIYGANGNHEQKMKENPLRYGDRYAKYKNSLKKAGILLLENETSVIRKKNFQINVTGIEIPLSNYGHFVKKSLTQETIRSLVGKPERNAFTILLAHNPVYMEEYWNWGADLVFSGHLHGGVVRLPYLGGVITPQIQFFPKYSGDLYQKNGHWAAVSRGLGTHTVNVRLFNMAELVCLDLTGKSL